MTKLEKVLKGLECCTTSMGCKACPYSEKGVGTDDCQLESTQDALELLKLRNWHSVKTNPPRVGQYVLILTKYGHVSDAKFTKYRDEYYFDPYGYALSAGFVTHWMPLWMPLLEPPKEDA